MTLISEPKTPMMVQWAQCKEAAGDALLLFRLGDFYEAFEEDAVLIAKEIDLTLTKRQEIPMCGVPAHNSEIYIDRLIAKGFRVAIAEQVEDPKSVKGLVKREIVRIVTPGTLVQSSLLSEKKNNYIASVCCVNAVFGLALLDLTTAEFRALECRSEQDLISELSKFRPSELLLSEKLAGSLFTTESKCLLTVKKNSAFDHESSLDLLLRHFRTPTLDGFGLKGMVAAINAAGALLTYLKEELKLNIAHIREMRTDAPSNYLFLSYATQRHLELIQPLGDTPSSPTLLSTIDQTATAMGARTLRHWITHPLLSCKAIEQRQDAVEELFRSSPSQPLKEIGDLERLIMRTETGSSSPRDLLGLAQALHALPHIREILAPFQSELLRKARAMISDLTPLASKISSALVDHPPLRLSDGGIFKKGFHPELDELLLLKTDSQSWMANYQTRLREETGIKTLKVGFRDAFGYYIEVSRGQSERMPAAFTRRQTLVNAERFISPELKEFEQRMLTADARIALLETKLFQELRQEAAAHAPAIKKSAEAIALFDVLLSFALTARENRWSRPTVDEGSLLQIEGGRHPVIESQLPRGTFIPNDLTLDEKERLMLITGPNMAGKSTYLRQTALIALLAQMGSFVPATKAHIGIIDKIFTRIGASDDLARGQSTFMVEMAETAAILHLATERSLIVLDEIGRGTSTYDGISIAWAVAEHLLKNGANSPKTLFATHYFELTELEGKIPGAVNYNVTVKETEDSIVFMHKIARGKADRSYGIHVAKLAGLPPSVVRRAEALLAQLEKGRSKSTYVQLDLFNLS